MTTLTDWSNTRIRHGTRSGWNLHRKLDQRPCDACYKAQADSNKRYRSSDARTRRARQTTRAQMLAYGRLARNHPEEWRELYEAAKQEIIGRDGAAGVQPEGS